MKFHPTGSYPASLKDTTLIIPIVSTANLPQLAVDLLISSLALERVGILDGGLLLLPVVGGREDGLLGVTTPLEVYGKQGWPFHLVQQRSPVIKSRKEEFVISLLDFVKSSQFASVLILAGVDLSQRIDAHMSTPTYYLQPRHTTSSALAASPLSRIPAFLPSFSPPSYQTQSSDVPVLPSSGLTPLLLRSLSQSSLEEVSFPPTLVILQYVLEGDNRPDAVILATIVAQAIGVSEEFTWKEPGSWRQGLFGTPHDQTLFG